MIKFITLFIHSNLYCCLQKFINLEYLWQFSNNLRLNLIIPTTLLKVHKKEMFYVNIMRIIIKSTADDVFSRFMLKLSVKWLNVNDVVHSVSPKYSFLLLVVLRQIFCSIWNIHFNSMKSKLPFLYFMNINLNIIYV